MHAGTCVERARALAHVPVKQAVISASALSLLYPPDGIDGYPRAAFVEDLLAEAEADIRGCLEAGAHTVQIDFTEGRSVKLDPTRGLLRSFIALNHARSPDRPVSSGGPRQVPGMESTASRRLSRASMRWLSRTPKPMSTGSSRKSVSAMSSPP